MMWWTAMLACSDPWTSALEHGKPAELGPGWDIPFGSSEYEATDKKRVTTFDRLEDEPYVHVLAHGGKVEGLDLVLPTADEVAKLREAWGPPTGTAPVKERPEPDIRGLKYVEGAGTAETWMRADGSAVATLWTQEDGGGRVTLRPWWGLEKAIAGLPQCEHFPGIAQQRLRPGIEPPTYNHDLDKHGPYLLPSVSHLDAGSHLDFYVHTIVWQVHDPDGAIEKAVEEAIAELPRDGDGYTCPDKAGTIYVRRGGTGLEVRTHPFETAEEKAEREAQREAAKPKTALEAAQRQATVVDCITTKSNAVELEFGVKDGKVTSPRVYDIPTSFSNAPAARRPRSDTLAKCLMEEARSWHFDPSFEEEKLVISFSSSPF